MSQFSLNINLNDKKKNNKRKQMNHEQLQNQYDALFRNLQSFAKTILHQSTSKTSFTNNKPMIPKSRYFNLRVEFKCNNGIHNANSITTTNSRSNRGTTDINRNEMLLDIPWALDPSLEVNKSFLVQNYNDNPHHGSSTSNQYTNRVPSITKSLKDLIHLPIGQVVEENVTGLGVQLIAYHRDDDGDVDADYDDSANEFNEIYTQMCSNNDVNNKLNGNQNNDEWTEARLEQAREVMQKRDGVTSASECIPFRNNTIAKGTIAFALPHCPRKVTKGTRRTDDATLTLHYLPCAILDHRIRGKKSILDYKVQFFDQGFEKANMKKQWIAFNKVIPYHEMKEKASYELERSMVGMDWTSCHSIPSTVMQNVAMTLNLDTENIEKLIFKSPINEIIENRTRSDDLNDFTQKCADNFKLVYSYAVNPISVVI